MQFFGAPYAADWQGRELLRWHWKQKFNKYCFIWRTCFVCGNVEKLNVISSPLLALRLPIRERTSLDGHVLCSWS